MPCVVGDDLLPVSFINRNIEVHTKQDSLASDIDIANR
jgi:hypothetical protein